MLVKKIRDDWILSLYIREGSNWSVDVILKYLKEDNHIFQTFYGVSPSYIYSRGHQLIDDLNKEAGFKVF